MIRTDVNQLTRLAMYKYTACEVSDNPMQCSYAESKRFCTASSQDSLCHLVLLSWI